MLIMSVSKLGLHLEQRWPEAQERKGHDIGHIVPPGKLCPLYQRITTGTMSRCGKKQPLPG